MAADFALEVAPVVGLDVGKSLDLELCLEPFSQAIVMDEPHTTVTLAGRN